MATLKKRIEALERDDPADTGPMFIHLVAMGASDKEIRSIHGCGGSWERLPGETEDELRERAKREGKPHPNGVLIFQCR